MNQQLSYLIPMIIYGLALLVFALGIALAFLAVSYRKVIEKLNSFEERETKILAKANQDALDIVKKAQIQASSIIEGSGNLVKYNNSLLERDLKSVSERELATYSQALDYLKQEVLGISKNIPKDINNIAQQEFMSLRRTYAEQFGKIFETANLEVEKYKQQRLEEINKKLLSTVNEVTVKVIQKSLTQREHTELVIRSLEEAKKHNVL